MSHEPGPTFRALHQPGNSFILANVWDAASAKLLAANGAQVLGASSWALAATLGLNDGNATLDQALEHAQNIVAPPVRFRGILCLLHGPAELWSGVMVLTKPYADFWHLKPRVLIVSMHQCPLLLTICTVSVGQSKHLLTLLLRGHTCRQTGSSLPKWAWPASVWTRPLHGMLWGPLGTLQNLCLKTGISRECPVVLALTL